MNLRLPLAAVAVATLALVGCSASSGVGDGAGSGDRLHVVATTTQLVDFATQVGGDDIEVTGLLAPGASAHHFDPSPADLLALGRADVVIVNGVDLETFVDGAVEASGFDGAMITASDGIDLDEARAITAEAAHEGESAAEHAGHADDADHDHKAHADDAGHADHAHGDINPHIWTSPRLAAGMVEEIARGLASADPGSAEAYERRADDYLTALDELDAWVATQFERVPESDRVLVSGHDSLRYFLHDYDIEFAGSLLPSFDDNAEPSAAEIDALVAEIRERGVRAVFVESSMSPKLARTVASEADVAVVDADALYADALAAEGAAATYLGATVHNTRTILEAWGVAPDPLPAGLEGR